MDPATAYTVVTTVCYPIIKLGGIGASYIGPWLGFGAAGVVKGSLAAAAQSSIPNVVASSVFAGMQSATTTATAVGGSIVGVPIATTAVAAYGAYKVYSLFR